VFVPSGDWMIVNNELGKMWKEVDVAGPVETLRRNLPAGNEANHEEVESE
jgi:hypothetical protein